MSKIEKLKNHIKTHKEAYITGGVCLVVGAATILIVTKKSDALIKVTARGIFYKSPITAGVVIPQGHPGYVVQNTSTGEIFMSQAQAAKAVGVQPSVMSSHLNGKTPDVSGYIFERLGVAVDPMWGSQELPTI